MVMIRDLCIVCSKLSLKSCKYYNASHRVQCFDKRKIGQKYSLVTNSLIFLILNSQSIDHYDSS